MSEKIVKVHLRPLSLAQQSAIEQELVRSGVIKPGTKGFCPEPLGGTTTVVPGVFHIRRPRKP